MSDKIHWIQFRKTYFSGARFAYARNVVTQKKASLFAASQVFAPDLLSGVT